jgi:transposase-like protein
MPRNGTFEGKHAQARELYEEGYSCRAIAEKLGHSPSTISRWAKDEGLRFDRSQTDMATRAHTVDLAAARMELTQKLMVSASDALDSLDRPWLVFNFGGKENTYEEHYLDEVPVDARVKVHTLAGIAIDKATRILEKDNGGLEQAIGTLDLVGKTLTAAAEAYRQQAASTDEPG